ncbi:MAG: hypothetical protein JWN44_1984 [Myxococcales bacterium]|nr:hypothetical protein [Myxococcales bacterium]
MRPVAKWLALSVVVAAASCAQTSIVATWKDPNASSVHFNRVLVVVPSRDPSLRRTAEDELVRRIDPARAVPSYTQFKEDELLDRERLKQRAQEAGFDGMVVFRIARVEKETTWVPGAYWGPYYAIGGWPMWDPGYMQTDTVVHVETDVYDVQGDRLVWASRSKTYDPRSMKALVDDVSRAVGKQMKKQGLL